MRKLDINFSQLANQFLMATQKETILDHMSRQAERWFLASEFSAGKGDCPFIGYEAPIRIGDLCRAGLVISRWSQKKTERNRSLKEYSIKAGKVACVDCEMPTNDTGVISRCPRCSFKVIPSAIERHDKNKPLVDLNNAWA